MNSTSDDFFKNVEIFSKGQLKKTEDLQRLIEFSFKEKKINKLEETAFYSKYLQGLLKIIQRGETSLNDEVFSRYQKEYFDNIEKIKSNLQEIIKNSGDFYKSIFIEKYFSLTKESMQNLNDLCYDLSWVKMYLNNSKNQ